MKTLINSVTNIQDSPELTLRIVRATDPPSPIVKTSSLGIFLVFCLLIFGVLMAMENIGGNATKKGKKRNRYNSYGDYSSDSCEDGFGGGDYDYCDDSYGGGDNGGDYSSDSCGGDFGGGSSDGDGGGGDW